jgi:hypothetical protein
MAKNIGEQYNATIPVKLKSSDTRYIAQAVTSFPFPFKEGNYQSSQSTRSTENAALGRIKTRHRYLTDEMKEIRRLYIMSRTKMRLGGTAADQWVAGRLGKTLLDLMAVVEEMELILKNS